MRALALDGDPVDLDLLVLGHDQLDPRARRLPLGLPRRVGVLVDGLRARRLRRRDEALPGGHVNLRLCNGK